MIRDYRDHRYSVFGYFGPLGMGPAVLTSDHMTTSQHDEEAGAAWASFLSLLCKNQGLLCSLLQRVLQVSLGTVLMV